jgi:molybdopterin converting factor small subunit
MPKFVKVARLGSQVKELWLEDDATVGSAIEAAEVEAEDEAEIRVNNRDADSDTPLENNDIVTIVPPIQGG